MGDALLGLDIGTSSTKAVLFDVHGKELARAESDPYPLLTPSRGRVEQDPEVLWTALGTVIHRIVKEISANQKIIAICMAAQSGSLLAADADMSPLTPVITWLDGRTKDMVERWKGKQVDQKIRKYSGWSISPGLPLPTIAWLRENSPEIHQNTKYFLSVNDFLAYRLTGKRITNPSNAGGMLLLDIQNPGWHEELCHLAGIDQDQLSSVLPSGALIGPLHADLCRDWGLPDGIPLINGAHDQACTAAGLGVLNPGRMLLACGTAWVYSSPWLTPELDQIPDNLDLNYHAVPDAWIISQSLGGLGASLAWWISQVGPENREQRFKSFNAAVSDTNPNHDLYFMPITGGFDDPATTRPGGLIGLGLNHSWVDIGRAIMESPGYELRWALESWDPVPPIERLWMVGGAASNPIWPEILASITGIPIQVPAYSNWPAVGAAVLAGVGSGVYSDLKTGAEIFQRGDRIVEPDPQMMATYSDLFGTYRRLREKWKDL